MVPSSAQPELGLYLHKIWRGSATRVGRVALDTGPSLRFPNVTYATKDEMKIAGKELTAREARREQLRSVGLLRRGSYQLTVSAL